MERGGGGGVSGLSGLGRGRDAAGGGGLSGLARRREEGSGGLSGLGRGRSEFEGRARFDGAAKKEGGYSFGGMYRKGGGDDVSALGLRRERGGGRSRTGRGWGRAVNSGGGVRISSEGMREQQSRRLQQEEDAPGLGGLGMTSQAQARRKDTSAKASAAAPSWANNKDDDMLGSDDNRKERAEFLESLEVGEIVVHSGHGIGRFVGFESIRAPGKGTIERYFVLEYKDGTMREQVNKASAVTKYRGTLGGSGSKAKKEPPLDSLSRPEVWTKRKRTALGSIRKLAVNVLKLQALRNLKERDPYADTDKLQDFESIFPYEPTPDQKTAFAAVRCVSGQHCAAPVSRTYRITSLGEFPLYRERIPPLGRFHLLHCSTETSRPPCTRWSATPHDRSKIARSMFKLSIASLC